MMRWQPSFWTQSRPVRTSHAETRPRNRIKTMSLVDTRVTPGVNFEVENFRIYGGLRRTETEVRNTLPTALTIETEKTLLCFEKQRKLTPMDVDYTNFYRCLSASVSATPNAQTPLPRSRAEPGAQKTPLPSASGCSQEKEDEAVSMGRHSLEVPSARRTKR